MSKIHFVSKLLNILASIVLLAMMLLTVADVCFRYFFKAPIIGTTELTEAMMASISFLGLAWCAVKDEHLKVDLLVERFRPVVRSVVTALTVLLGLCIVALISCRNVIEAWSIANMNITSSLLRVPMYPFYLIVALGCGMLCLVMVGILFQNISRILTK